MGILSGNPKNEPMHFGEVFGTWSFLLAAKGAVADYQTKINHTGDEDLKKLLEEATQCKQDEIKKIEALLKEVGIGLPPTPPERPVARLEDIPTGAKFADNEIAAVLGTSIGASLVACSQIMSQSVREDIAMMFGQIHMQAAALGAKILRLNKEKGWLIPPPLHHNRAEE